MVPCPRHLPPLSDHAQCCLGPSRARGPRLGPEPCRPALRYGNRRLPDGSVWNLPSVPPRQRHRASLAWRRGSFPDTEGGLGYNGCTFRIHSPHTLRSRRQRDAGQLARARPLSQDVQKTEHLEAWILEAWGASAVRGREIGTCLSLSAMCARGRN